MVIYFLNQAGSNNENEIPHSPSSSSLHLQAPNQSSNNQLGTMLNENINSSSSCDLQHKVSFVFFLVTSYYFNYHNCY